MKVKVKSLKFSNRLVSVTGYDKRVKVKLTRKNYVQLLAEIEKWPLPLRVAAELHRNGITVERFEDEMHMEGNPLSKRVYEHLMQFRFHKGPDPERITPVLPVYLRFKSPTQFVSENSFKGRPSEEDADRFIRKLFKKKVEDGWKESDLIEAFRRSDSDNEDVIKIASNLDEDLPDVQEIIKYKTRKVPQYFALIGNDWIQAKSKEEIMRFKEEAKIKEKIIPVEEPKTHCYYCKFPLNELVFTTRNSKGELHRNMHPSCYWMNVAKPEEIMIGMRVLSPVEGVFYEWTGGKEGWAKRTPLLGRPGSPDSEPPKPKEPVVVHDLIPEGPVGENVPVEKKKLVKKPIKNMPASVAAAVHKGVVKVVKKVLKESAKKAVLTPAEINAAKVAVQNQLKK